MAPDWLITTWKELQLFKQKRPQRKLFTNHNSTAINETAKLYLPHFAPSINRKAQVLEILSGG